jgi:uncharacterized protein (DUF305 family)
VRGGGINDAHLASLRQVHRLARGIVVQAQDREIGRVQRITARLRRLAAGIVEDQQVELAAVGQPVGNFQAGGA